MTTNSKKEKVPLYECQQRIVDDNKERIGIFLGTGVGKTLPTLMLSEGRVLVICPKQQMLDETWQKNDRKFNLGKNITVINYDMFWRKADEYGHFDTVILDEGHRALGVLPETRQRRGVEIPKTSKTFEAIYLYLKRLPPKRFYIVTATPVSKPMNMWAIAKLYGFDWDFFKFRTAFYISRKMGYRSVWLPKKDDATKARLAKLVMRFGYTGSLSDFMDVPEQLHLKPEDDTIEYIDLSIDQKKELAILMETEADPLVRRSYMRTIENGILYGKKIEEISEREDRMIKETRFFPSKKIDYILERAEEFPKMFVFAAYTAQVEAIAKALKDGGYEVMTVTGATKDRGTVFERAEAMERVIVVCQTAICEGYRVPSAPCMIFASKSNRFLHYDQGKGRILDGQHLKKNLYIHLVVKGGADYDCHKAIISGEDFIERLSPL